MTSRSVLLLLAAALTTTLGAHPMGNFSISHYARLTPQPDRVDLLYAIDLAEIPTFELLREWKLEGDSPREQLEARAVEQAQRWAKNLVISVDGKSVEPQVGKTDLVVADGAGGLPVIRVTSEMTLPLDAGRSGKLSYADNNYPDRAGWKEIVVPGGEPDRSNALTAYPEDPDANPPQQLQAELELAAQTPRRSSTPPGTVRPNDSLSRLLMQKDLGLTAMLIALSLAFGFGAMHALSPGHGKTIVAAYLVGSRGTFGHALFLGAMVTFTHTISVFLLGLGTLFLSQYVVPDKIYPILGALSGFTIVWIGATLFYQRLRKLVHSNPGHSHSHAHGHLHHHHHDHDHGEDEDGHSHLPEGEVTLTSLLGLAISGGLVPCPSALVLLLSAIAIGKIAFGLALLTAFSLGLAGVLIAIGCAVLYAKHLLPDTPQITRSPLVAMMPVISAGVITVVGLFMTAAALGVINAPWAQV